ncbi:transmembrane and coiled-coil domain-containing protein 3-like [Clavelina lepadiformis]|uniref:transmembrane and coiled-coil domain-containing protein 3-like n=1 Tax=Clavelina lepadiformis TaxID=159417 RepID=UPI004043121C
MGKEFCIRRSARKVFLVLFVLEAYCALSKSNPIGNGDAEKNNGNKPHEQVQAVIRKASSDIKKSPKNSDHGKEKLRANVGGMQSKGLSNMKVRLEGKVKQAQERVNISKKLSHKEKEFKLHVLEMFLEEMRESEKDMIEAEEALRKSLTMDFWNASTLQENSRKRLEALRVATLKEEKSFNRMREFEERMKTYMDETNSTSWMGELFKELSQAADQLENRVAEHEFSDKEINQLKGANIEAVLHIKEGIRDFYGDQNLMESDVEEEILEDEKQDLLIDSHNNKYVLTKLQDSTSPYVDHILIVDIIVILLLSIPLGCFCEAVGVPSLFGYILTGVILGPSGANFIQQMVQIETIGELGVFMIMFCTGMEFSVDRIRKVWRVAVQTPVYTTLLMVFTGVFIGSIVIKGIPVSESAFIAACLSLSSTPLVTRFLQGGSKDNGALEYSSILLGVLVVQDVQLSLMISLIPGLATHRAGESNGDVFLHFTLAVLKTLTAVALAVLVSFLVIRYIMPHYTRHMMKQSREHQLLAVLAVMLVYQLFTSYLGISMELGCFMAGVVISQSIHQPALEQKILAIHDYLSVIFFAAIGFHVFPSFVFVELTLLITLTAFVVAGKYLVYSVVLNCLLHGQARKLKVVISAGLAQVSEFSFVLSSRGRHLKIITREIYLLILSVTTLSLIMAPLLWKLSLWSYRVRNPSVHVS